MNLTVPAASRPAPKAIGHTLAGRMLSPLDAFLVEILRDAIALLRREQVALHTFAFYHDHESAAASVCADTAENSRRVVDEINRFNMKYFVAATRDGDLA